MTVLYMDIDALYSTLSVLRSTRERFQELIQALDGTVDSMITFSWHSPSASKYGNDYFDWEADIQYFLSDLDNLIRDLEREVNRWEEMSSSYSRSYYPNSFPIKYQKYYNLYP